MYKRLGEILSDKGLVTSEQVDEALEAQKAKGGRLGEILIKMKLVDEAQVLRAVAEQLDLPFVESVKSDEIDVALISKIPIAYAKRKRVLPVARDEQSGLVRVVVADPLDFGSLDDLSLFLGGELDIGVATSGVIFDTINLTYDRMSDTTDEVMGSLEEEQGYGDIYEEPPDLIDVEDEEAPIIRLVNHLMFRAVKERASDIHIEPFESEIVVRFRIDGVLYEVMKPPKRFQSSIASRIKIMADLNIAEKRLPQDGRIRIKIAGNDIDIRTSVIPTAHGERVVMRLLDKSSVRLDLEDLGLGGVKFDQLLDLIQRPHGILLVTGPTGSGKTTTLYAALVRRNTPDVNILTVEDPIEYQLRGIGQMQVNPKINLTFAGGLRAFLRQDPDIILIGEIRDLETAEIAVQASLTGHLVFSTLHTNDSASALTRLVDMGVEPFLVSSSLVGVMAQRLVRVLCDNCKKAVEPKPIQLKKLGVAPEDLNGRPIFEPVGCDACLNTGYLGRTAIYEILRVTPPVRAMVLQNVDAGTIKKQAVEKDGMLTLRMDGADKVLAGMTSIEEVLRVTQADFD
ncbi:MAG: type II secretion system ATPase GspE [Candidatus Lernaella stagnicola]|nr:type II secretion system ATPase GspE [Candidatus Lernaella stagnicola]